MNLCDKWLSGFYGKIPHENYTLLDRASRTLLSNIMREAPNEKLPWHPWRGITPSQIGFKGIWNWDSAFHAVGVSRWDAKLAQEQILMILALQNQDGGLPDVLFANGKLVDNFGKPPVMPWAAMIVDMRENDDEFLRKAYPAFVKNESHWRRNRGGDRQGLFNYDSIHSDPETRLKHAKYESGWDNSVRWDGGIYEVWPVDLNCFMVMLYRAMSYMAGRLGISDDVKRWDKAGVELAARIEDKLWDNQRQAYHDYDFGKKAFVDALSPASFMPLYVGTASRERAEKMAKVAAEQFNPGWPTVAYDHPQFDPESYWRGRMWLNVAYFALKGLKDYGFNELAESGRNTILSWVRNDPSQIFENYNSRTGEPLGSPQFSWSSVFTIEFLLNWTD